MQNEKTKEAPMQIIKQNSERVKILWKTKIKTLENKLAYHAYQTDGTVYVDLAKRGKWR
jgi:hypothetical protein